MTTTQLDTNPAVTIAVSPAFIPLAPPANAFGRRFWIALDGKTIAADEEEVQTLVDAGRLDLDIQSQDPGSTWTKPAALGFIAKSATPASKPPPAAPSNWPIPTMIFAGSSTAAIASAPIAPEPRAPAPVTPRSTSTESESSGKPEQPFVLLDFAMALVTGVRTGVGFRLPDGNLMASSIPEADVPINADIVRQGLAQVEKEYKLRGLAPDSMKLVETQQSMIVLATFLNFQGSLTGGPVSRHLIEFGTAVADLQHTLHIVNDPNED